MDRGRIATAQASSSSGRELDEDGAERVIERAYAGDEISEHRLRLAQPPLVA